MRTPIALRLLTAGLVLALGCARASSTSRIGLLSDGDLEGKRLAGLERGPVLEGSQCHAIVRGITLSDAFRDAIEGTDFDTLVDVQVENRSNGFSFAFWDNCVTIRGHGVRSADLPEAP